MALKRFTRLQSLYRSGRHDEAAAALDGALRIAPKDPNLLHLAAQVAEATGQAARAVVFYRRALAARPDWMEAAFNLARVLGGTGEYAEAITLLTRLGVTHPAVPQVWEALAKFRQRSDDLPAAIECWRKALALSPGRQDWRAQYLLLLRQACDWREAVGDLDALPPQAVTVLSDDPDLQMQSAVRYARERFGKYDSTRSHPRRRVSHFMDSSNGTPAFAGGTVRSRPRIGYLSADFHAHATAYLMAELFSLHDREKFEVFAYSYGVDDGSAIRARLREQAEHFIELNRLTAAQSAERIRRDGIDILIDLKGYTRGGQLEILAHRPAPIQMHWLGYPGTLGTDFVDYFIADSVTVPEGSEAFFTERVIRLPHCYQINDRRRAIGNTQSRGGYGLPETGLVLASFNQTYKITPEVFALWCEIMRELPDAVLWLYRSNPHAPDNLRREAAARGLDPARLIFAHPVPLPEHLARYAHVDLALDTFPVGGHTTTSDALWAGTPVVSMKGRSFVSLVAASVLTAAGLPELATTAADDYKKLVLDLARDPCRLAELKLHLKTNRLSLPLFDTPRFVRDFEEMLTGALARIV